MTVMMEQTRVAQSVGGALGADCRDSRRKCPSVATYDLAFDDPAVAAAYRFAAGAVQHAVRAGLRRVGDFDQLRSVAARVRCRTRFAWRAT